jgi:hypothetical protein
MMTERRQMRRLHSGVNNHFRPHRMMHAANIAVVSRAVAAQTFLP